ncbi:MAG: CHAT domain-containing protein [Anaerolineae bacterium]|nr:CHAT domain-containing protein [Anaerolineae bacterium]
MATQDYLNFELNIEAYDNTLSVTVNDSPVGSVAVEVANPFTAAEVARIVGILEDSIPVTRAEKQRQARAYGEKLFNTIFSGQIYAAYLASQERAGERGLRVRLGLDNAGNLEDAPWELLRDPRADYLALSRQTPVIRYPRILTVRPLVEVTLPLRVLVMISSPSDQQPLDTEAEWRTLQEATAELRARGLLEMERLDDAQLLTLQRTLRSGTMYHVFHYIGHAAFDETSQSGMLAFEDPRTNETIPISGEALARELSEENSIRLVVLNACQGARQNDKDPFAGIASSIVARGVPAVVAMQFAISDDASRVFSQEFYRALSEGYPIEAAMAESRRALSSSVDNLEWATPVLYLRAATGVLFPKRGSELGRVSTGGLREVLRTPIGMIAGIIGLLVIGLLAFMLIRPGPPVVIPTLTPTVEENRDVDLVVSSLRYFPPDPVPGQRVAVTITLRNKGTTDSRAFKWAWFATDPSESATPTVQGDVQNLAPGQQIILPPIPFAFGWWGTYTTSAWVNYDHVVPETNPFNNLLSFSLTTSNDPSAIDFSLLPNGTALTEPLALKGDEFTPWNLSIAPNTSTDPNCARAVPRVNVVENTNRLSSGLPDKPNTCANLPLTFMLAQPVGGAAIQFVATVGGRYSLDLFDGNDKKLQSAAVDAAPGQVAQIRVPQNGNGLSNVRKAVFSGPPNGVISIQGVSFSQPEPTQQP